MNRSQTEATDSVVPREAVATQNDVVKVLALTPEKLEDLKREQQLLLYRSRAKLSPDERRVARGIELEAHHRLTGNSEGLAEALNMQGRYSEAAEVSDNPVYTERAEAVEKEDKLCCDRFTESDGYNLPNHYSEFEGHSVRHGGTVSFIRCTKCGDLNAMPLPQHLAEQKAFRHSDVSDKERLNYFKK